MVGAKTKISLKIAKIIAVVLFSAFFIIPLWLVIIASLTDSVVFIQNGYSFWASALSIKAYSYVFGNPLVIQGIINSVLATVSVTVLSVLINTAAAYVLHEKRMPGHTFLNTMFVFTMFFNTGMIPIVLVIRELGLYNTVWALVVPAVINVYNILLILLKKKGKRKQLFSDKCCTFGAKL